MTEALIGLADRIMNSRYEFRHLSGASDRRLDHRKLVAAEPCDQVGLLEAAPDAGRQGLQQLVTDVMSERVVDALEHVDVDIKQSKLLAATGLR